MIIPILIIKNNRGSAIIVALLLLVTLTIIGVAATNTSVFESRIVGYEHRYQIDFYIADSGWKEGAMWLDNEAGPPASVNPNVDNIIKNYGFNTPPADPAPTDLSTLTPDNTTLSQYGVPYWYQVQYVADSIVAGSGPGFREFFYDTRSNANQTQQIDVRVSKIFRVGY
jgi:Tfp pilus assembly protein PilX